LLHRLIRGIGELLIVIGDVNLDDPIHLISLKGHFGGGEFEDVGLRRRVGKEKNAY
jgi:hypothetical protein